ncbi:MAG TPA: hypothetical protein VGS27_00895, partial [Candidatus Sulfotelmatobacter sp.]|nr:hypothetical protein [Candidatus Sulfotelmatobacter sp.]
SAARAEARLGFVISRSSFRNACGGQRPACFRKQGRRPQRPGNQSRFRAALDVFPFGNSLSRITAATGSAAIIRLSQELSRFAEPTLSQIVAPGNIKNVPPCEETVDDETSLWTTEEI